MNLVFVGSSPRAWGSEQHFVSLAKACHDVGHRVVAVVRAGSEVASLLRHAGVTVCATPFRGGADPRAMLATFKAVRAIHADWLVTPHQKHYWPMYVLARLTGTRLAVFRHLAYVRSWLTRVVFPTLTDRFFVVSDFALETLANDGAPRGRLTRLYNPIDLQRFRPDAKIREQIRADLNLPAGALVVGFVGRHETSKGVRVLRAAFEQAMDCQPNIYALWVGGGDQWSETRAVVRASRHGDRHRFIEWTRTPEQIYAALDGLVAPSFAPETFGRVVAEAQACGVPVIASTAGGLGETFAAKESGDVFSGSEPALLAKRIVDLCNDDRRRASMGRAGRQFVQRFDSRLIVHSFLQYLAPLDAAVPSHELAGVNSGWNVSRPAQLLAPQKPRRANRSRQTIFNRQRAIAPVIASSALLAARRNPSAVKNSPPL